MPENSKNGIFYILLLIDSAKVEISNKIWSKKCQNIFVVCERICLGHISIDAECYKDSKNGLLDILR